MVNKSKIGTLGQLTIPKELREKHYVHEGEKVLLVPVDYCVIAKHPSSTMRGRPKGKLNLKNFENDLREIRGKYEI